jgi:PAS domain S-box-containing protein
VSDTRIKLLLVEDDRIDRMAFERMVKSEKLPYDYYCVSSVLDGKEAIECGDFDVVVTDYRLGDGTAFDLLGAVPSDVAVVLVTGAGGEEVAVSAMKAGASDYLMKDANGNYLKTLPVTVENTVKAKATEKELKRYHEQLEQIVQERTNQLEIMNEDLRREIEERKRAEEALRAAHEKLEIRVEERTAELSKTNEQLRHQITERNLAEERLQKSKETMEAILNATNDCAFLLDTGGTFVAVNQTTAKTLAGSTDDLVGKAYFDLLPRDEARTRKERFDEVVRSGKAVRFEDSGDRRIYDHGYHPVFDSDGSVESVAVFCRDVTDSKKSQELSVQRQRLAALGEMAGGVAHNFNNLLQIVIGASGLAEAELESGDLDEVKNTLNQISESAQLGSETVKQLQDFARVRTQDPTADGRSFDLSVAVRQALEVSRPLWKSGPEKKGVRVRLKSRLAADCMVKGNQNELFEVIVNLVKNATEAMPQGGKIMVKSFLRGGMVYLKVADTGTGISPDNLNKVFEPFFTTKGAKGTGMGLSSSFGIINRHGGTITVKSKEGRGTIFTVRLPLVAGDDKTSGSGPRTAVDFSSNILVCDDQPQLVGLLAKALTGLGQTVFRAYSAEECIETYNGNRIDMVISDFDLPDADGWEVGAAIKEICGRKGIPKTPYILLTTQTGLNRETERLAESGVDRIIEKPVEYPMLFDAIRRLLEKHKRSSE